MKPDLDAEFDSAYRRLSPEHCESLDAAGVPRGLIMRGFVGVVRADRADPLYEPTPYGRFEFYLTPARAELSDSPESDDPEGTLLWGDILDLVAWRPDCPGRWLLRVGAARWLGCREPMDFDPFPVPVHPDPLTWFKAGAVGLVRLGQ